MSTFNKSRGIIVIALIVVVIGVVVTFKPADKPKMQEHKLIPVSSITHGHGLAVDPNDSSKVYIATHEGLLTLQNEKDLYQVGTSKDDYMGFSAHPTKSNTFFSSGHPTAGGNIGFQKSEDGAYNWQHVSDGNDGPVDFHALTVSPTDPTVFYGWFRGNIQRSNDEGKTWRNFRTSYPIVNLAADTKDKNTVYAAGPRGLQKSTDGGKTFMQLLDGFTAATAVDPSDNQHVLTFNEMLKLAESTDGGKTWQKLNQDFGDQTPLFIAFYRSNPKIAYLITEQNRLYKSQDGGKTWTEVSSFAKSAATRSM